MFIAEPQALPLAYLLVVTLVEILMQPWLLPLLMV